MVNKSIYSERVEKIRSKLAGIKVKGILFFDMSNIRYLTGFTGSDGVFFVGHLSDVLMVDGRYTIQAKRETEECEIFEYGDKIAGIIENINKFKLETVGFESTAVTYDFYIKLREKIDRVVLKPVSKEISFIRSVKDEAEITFIKKAADIAYHNLSKTVTAIKAGITEREIALMLEGNMREAGVKPSFEIIVASGINSALPHAKPSERSIKNGDFLVIDYGVAYRGYNSDETCTFAVGEITDKQMRVYNVVKEAHDKALNAVKDGVQCTEIDRIARDTITDSGFGKYFSHGTGHGVGLDVHELPSISTSGEGYLEEGMVITVEPGIYIPDMWGIRIEDMVLVKKNGCEILTKMPKELIIL